MVAHDVSEAAYVSQWVYVLTSRPAWGAWEVPVPFGRVRERSLTREAAFLEPRDAVQDMPIDQVADVWIPTVGPMGTRRRRVIRRCARASRP